MTLLVEGALRNPRLHHVGIVVANEKQALVQMKRLGLAEDYRGTVKAWDVLCIFTCSNGATPLEFVVPGPGSTLTSFNEGRGGLHHLAFAVPDIVEASRRLEGLGVKLVAPEPVRGAGPFLCNFVPPIYTRSYAVELIQEVDS